MLAPPSIDVIAPAKVKINSGKQKAQPRKENARKLNASGEKQNVMFTMTSVTCQAARYSVCLCLPSPFPVLCFFR